MRFRICEAEICGKAVPGSSRCRPEVPSTITAKFCVRREGDTEEAAGSGSDCGLFNLSLLTCPCVLPSELYVSPKLYCSAKLIFKNSLLKGIGF